MILISRTFGSSSRRLGDRFCLCGQGENDGGKIWMRGSWGASRMAAQQQCKRFASA
jgi:hypothetical protein